MITRHHSKTKLGRGLKKFVRSEKAKIRRLGLGVKEEWKMIGELYGRLGITGRDKKNKNGKKVDS